MQDQKILGGGGVLQLSLSKGGVHAREIYVISATTLNTVP